MARKRRRDSSKAPTNAGLSLADAERLIRVPKTLPLTLSCIEIDLGMNADWDLEGEGEGLRLIVSQSRRNPNHAKYQLMADNSIVLVRFEIEGPPHTNPDGQVVPCPHLHRFCEESPDAWAEPASGMFGDPKDLVACLAAFLAYCNIVQAPPIRTSRRFFR